MKILRKHILIVESDDNSVEMLRLYLGYANYRVKAADTCGEGLQLARTERVDLYLLGDGCEDGDIFELCRNIRALDSNTPIVFCSADASPANRARNERWRASLSNQVVRIGGVEADHQIFNRRGPGQGHWRRAN
jgi:DNA-binding response OmpR family regulator